MLILGAGLSGLSTAYFLEKKKIKAKIFEKEAKQGGLCCSVKRSGFTFDSSGHLLHFRDQDILSLVKKIMGNNLIKHKRNAYVYTFNKFIPYPFQANFHYLPEKVAQQCLSGFIDSKKYKTTEDGNFLQWIYRKFGKGIADHFMIPYNVKFWKIPLDELDHKWAERFVVIPAIKDIKGSLDKGKTKPLGYSSFFWYPRQGGIEELVKGFSCGGNGTYLNHQALRIDLDKKHVIFKNRRKEKFDILITTIPLPELGRIITGLPQNIKSNFDKLRWISIYNVNLGIKMNTQPGRHWIYFPQKNISFFRAGFFHNFSSSLVPPGKGSLYVDISYSKDKPIRKKDIVPRVKKCLKAAGIISDDNEICCENINDIKYGYPVYDKNYKSARKVIVDFLSKNNIVCCGRYGGWRYLSMEDVIIESKQLVNYLCK